MNRKNARLDLASNTATADPGRGVDAVERALTLLNVFHNGETGLSLKRLAADSGLNKATILRLAVSLERFGYLMRDEEGLYHLGPTLWQLGSAFRKNLRLGPYIRPVLGNLVAVTGESASFYVQRGSSGVCLYRVNSPRLARDHIEEGEIIPLTLGSSGQVLDAYSIQQGRNVARIRADGFYHSEGERDPEVAGIAAPVFGPDGMLLGAISVSGLLSRFTSDKVPMLQEAVCSAAAEIRTRFRAD
ncbi:MAG: IclR family transcriptional regulator [Jannaschia sp.]